MKRLGGVYLVIDPKRNWETLLQQLSLALKGGLHMVQIWNHWDEGISEDEKSDFLYELRKLCFEFDVAAIMHEDWRLAVQYGLNGVHFDQIPTNFNEVRVALKNKFIGLTVSNDLNQIRWADEQRISYISFCAVFPSSSVESCEIVNPETIKAARSITDLSIFLSGGIRPENISRLRGLKFDGVAVISGILDASNPTSVVESYISALNRQEE